MSHCLRPTFDDQGDEIEFCLRNHAVAAASVENWPVAGNVCDPDDWNGACETRILSQGEGHVCFEFLSRSDYPKDLFRHLGCTFPDLSFDIVAIDAGAGWSVCGQVHGKNAVFDEDADLASVYERVYKSPIGAGCG